MHTAGGGQTARMTDMLPTLPAAARPARTQTTPLVADQEFSFSASDFDRVRELIYQRAGISLHAGKQAMVYSRLSRRLRETSHRSFTAYLQWLQANAGASGEAEWQEFVNCLTTNLTAFFREDHHFHALVDDLKAIAGRNPGKPLRIWCSAASTGEEPYSIAITAVEALGSTAPVRIVSRNTEPAGSALNRLTCFSRASADMSPLIVRHVMPFCSHKLTSSNSTQTRTNVSKNVNHSVKYRSCAVQRTGNEENHRAKKDIIKSI